MDTFETFKERMMRDDVAPVIETVQADLLTPLSVYLTLTKNKKNAFLLESVEGGERLARYSFIGVDPDFIVSDSDGSVVYWDANGERSIEMSLMEYLRDVTGRHKIRDNNGLPPFLGGFIGYLGFQSVEWFEPSLGSDAECDSRFMSYSSVVAFDHVKQVIQIISTVLLARASEDGGLHRTYAEAKQKNRRIRAMLENGLPATPLTAGGDREKQLTSNWTREAFEDAVRKVQALIHSGDCYQVVLSQRLSRPTAASDVSLYRALRSINPSPYMFLLRFEDRSIIGASPEMLVRCQGTRLEYRPIAGTRPRGTSPVDDERLADEMRNDPKEVAEHLMLVDLGRNDLGRIAEFGSVEVDELMKVEKYSHVQHLVSSLSARLRPDRDRFDALAACFPAGTVSGAPKIRAIEIIRELEPDNRDVYAGAVGYFDYSGNMDTCIAIRTIVLEDGVAKIQAGAGIVADSVPELEYEESVDKAKALLRAVEIAEAHEL